MKNKKAFFGGIAIGIVITMLVNVFVFDFNFSLVPGVGLSGMERNRLLNKSDFLMKVIDDYFLEEIKLEDTKKEEKDKEDNTRNGEAESKESEEIIDKNKMIEGSYAGMVAALGDPYTRYFDKERFEDFTIDTEGGYVGIGVVVTVHPQDGFVTVMMPYEGSPGEKAGLQPGDKILKVNDEDITNLDLKEVVKKIKGPEGTSVNLSIYRPSTAESFDVDVTRENIEFPTVKHEMLDGDIGYLRIYGFDTVTYNQFIESLYDLEKNNEKGLIIDLRNNGGGNLSTVCQIADLLLPEGIITYTVDKNGKREELRSQSKTSFTKPLVILINGNSASASEILAGAVRDYKIGKLVGTTTFGKGLVQRVLPFKDGSALKITIAKYYTPSGDYINKKGIKPDFEVQLPEDYRYKSKVPKDKDNQLAKAIDIIKSELN